MKIFSIAISLIISSLFSSGQVNGDFVGICSSPNHGFHDFGFCSVDTNGNLNFLSIASVSYVHGFGENFFDTKSHKYYLLTSDTLNMYVMKFDIFSGQLDTILFRIDSLNDGQTTFWSFNISNLFFNCIDNSLYFMYFIPNKDSLGPTLKLAKINVNTGQMNIVDSFGRQALTYCQQYIDVSHQLIYYFHLPDYNKLYSYDLTNGAITTIQLNGNFNSRCFLSLTLNPVDNELYGILSDASNFPTTFTDECRVIKVNPLNGNVTNLSSSFNSNIISNILFNPTNDKIYFQGGNNMEKLVSFDLITHDISYKDFQHSFGYQIMCGLNSFNYNFPDSNSTISNFCQYAPTNFYSSNKSVSHHWNFGDAQSGTDNFSEFSNPAHIYTSPGIYNVEMTSYTCDSSITTYKQITILPFPDINIGNDAIICTNNPISPITLNAFAPNASYLWQDNSIHNYFTVNSPGTYWVNVSSICGTVMDTVILSGEICPCVINLNPTITSDFITIHIDCEITNYSNFILEFFDVLGRKIYSQNITENNFNINLVNFTNGPYFYRFRNSELIIKGGKIIIEK